MELSLEDSLKQVLGTLPPVIRDYITQEKYTAAAQNLMRQYKLRIDQGGVLERELLLLLMGVENPQEFVDALIKEAGLDQATVDGITRDINNQIFVPLRAQEMKASTAMPKAPAAAPSPAQPGTHFQLQNKIPTPQRPMPSRSPMPASAPRQSLPQMPFDHMLEDHEEPHIDFKPQSAPAPRPATPATPQAARTAPPPPNLPGQMPPAPASSAPAPVAPKVIPPGGRAPGPIPPTVAPTPAAKPPAPAAGLKFSTPPMPSGTKYSADPYREPIDEEGN